MGAILDYHVHCRNSAYCIYSEYIYLAIKTIAKMMAANIMPQVIPQAQIGGPSQLVFTSSRPLLSLRPILQEL